MVLRKLAVALLSAGVLLPGLAHALAIGDIKTKSALNQPYLGEVLLTDVGDLSADEIRVDLATQDEFKQMGVERSTQLTDLRFAVVKQSDGTAVIRVTSVQPVTEPDLDFVLRVSWPGNTSMREFVALLDLPSGQVSATPVMQPAVTTPVVAPVASSTAPEAEPTPAEASPAPTAQPATKSHAAAKSSGPSRYRPRQGEGLWSIALKHRPSHHVTVQQTMMAIEKANPAAFPTGNVNLIEAGHSLVIPPLEEIQRVSAREAAQAVMEQDQAWHQGGRSESAVPAKPLEAAQINTAAHQAKAEAPVAGAGGQVHLVAPGRADKNKLAAADASLARDNEKKAQAEQLENARLKAQVDSDQAKLQAQQAQLALQDKKLAELQAAMKAQPQSHQDKQVVVSVPSAGAVPKPAVAAVSEVNHPPVAVVAKPAPALTAVIKAKPVSMPPQPVAKPDVIPPNPVPVATQGGPSFIVWGAGGIAALAALVGGLIAFRRHRDQKAELDRLATHDGHAFEHEEPIFTGLHDDHGDTDDFALPESLATEPVAEAPYDALQEAEDFLARGRYPQAAGILTRAIEQEPERSDLRLRLMECQVAMGDAEGFAEQEHALEEMGDLDALDHAESLRAQLPIAKSVSPASEAGTIDFAPVVTPPADTEVAADFNVDSLEDMEFDFNQSLSQTQLHAVDDQLLEQPVQPEGDLELPPLDLDLEDDFKLATDSSLKDVSMPADDHHDDLSFAFGQEKKGAEAASSSTEAEELASASWHEEPAKVEEDKVLDLGELVLDDGQAESSHVSLDDAELHDLDFSLDDLEAATPMSPHDQLPVDTLAGTEGDDLSDMDFDLESLEDLESSPALAPAKDTHDELADPLLSEVSDHQSGHEEIHGYAADEPAEQAHLESGMDSDFESMELDDMSLEDFAALESPSAEYDLSVVEPEMTALAQDSVDSKDETTSQPADEHSLDLGDDFDFLADADENATKLDLAKAYMDMGDLEGARDILQEVLAEGSSQQQEEARGLLLQAS